MIFFRWGDKPKSFHKRHFMSIFVRFKLNDSFDSEQIWKHNENDIIMFMKKEAQLITPYKY